MTALYFTLLGLYAALHVADYATTIHALGKGALEANPFLRPLMTRYGPRTALALAKLLAVVPFVFLTPSRLPLIVLGALCLLIGAAVANNMRVIRRLP